MAHIVICSHLYLRFLDCGNSNIFYFHLEPKNWGKWSNLTNIVQMGWNHHLVFFSFQNLWIFSGKKMGVSLIWKVSPFIWFFSHLNHDWLLKKMGVSTCLALEFFFNTCWNFFHPRIFPKPPKQSITMWIVFIENSSIFFGSRPQLSCC